MVQRIGSLWNSAQRLRSEIQLVSQQYPTTFTLTTGGTGQSTSTSRLTISSVILLPLKKAKVVLEYNVGSDALSHFPAGMNGIETDVRVIYGDEYVLLSLPLSPIPFAFALHLASCPFPRLILSLDLPLLKMAAEETIATIQENGYVGGILNAARDVAQQYA